MTDLEKFKKAFLSDRLKEYPNKIEYRGQNIDSAVPQARKIVEELNLNLEVVSTGQMAQYNTFEVKVKNL